MIEDPWISNTSYDPADYAVQPERDLPPARRYVPALVALVALLLLGDCVAHWVTQR